MSKEKFLKFAAIKKDDEKNIAFHRLTPPDFVIVSPKSLRQRV